MGHKTYFSMFFLFLSVLISFGPEAYAEEASSIRSLILGAEENPGPRPQIGSHNPPTQTQVKNEIPDNGENDEEEKTLTPAPGRSQRATLFPSREMPPSFQLHKHAFGLGLGQTFLSGEFSDNGEDKITPELYYSYTASYSFDILANLHRSTHEQGDRKVVIQGMSTSVKSRLYHYDSLAPYVLGGLGFYMPSTTRQVNGKLVRSRDKMAFGTNLGLGLDLILNRNVTIGTLLHYHNPFDVKQESAPAIEGSYYKLLLTFMYTFK